MGCEMKYDCLVLGAGIVGISAALHLQKRGRSVVMVDRRPAAEETSHGNAGIIQTEAVQAYSFPRQLGQILRYALNGHSEARLHYSALPEVGMWLWKYWRHGSPEHVRKTAEGLIPLVRQCMAEHEALIDEAGVGKLLRRNGYLKVYRDASVLGQAVIEQQGLKNRFGVNYEAVDLARLRELEPHLAGLAGGIFLPDPASVSDPGAVGKVYCELFQKHGGTFLTADAQRLEATVDGWQVQSVTGPIEAREAVLALGIWSRDVLAGLGVRVPLQAKRGYHMHYGSQGTASLNRPVLDADNGYVLAPMRKGVRLTTGAEFARNSAPPSPVQLGLVEPHARRLYPLAERIDERAWMGQRPCLPDMLPMVGEIPGHKGLWANFGHQHLGFTLGPVTGRLLAEAMTGGEAFADIQPYKVDRF